VKDDRLFLIPILESIRRIEDYTADGCEAFFADPKTRDAILQDLETPNPLNGCRQP
jgi:uncharacterized protein with HEPN domain